MFDEDEYLKSVKQFASEASILGIASALGAAIIAIKFGGVNVFGASIGLNAIITFCMPSIVYALTSSTKLYIFCRYMQAFAYVSWPTFLDFFFSLIRNMYFIPSGTFNRRHVRYMVQMVNSSRKVEILCLHIRRFSVRRVNLRTVFAVYYDKITLAWYVLHNRWGRRNEFSSIITFFVILNEIIPFRNPCRHFRNDLDISDPQRSGRWRNIVARRTRISIRTIATYGRKTNKNRKQLFLKYRN